MQLLSMIDRELFLGINFLKEPIPPYALVGAVEDANVLKGCLVRSRHEPVATAEG